MPVNLASVRLNVEVGAARAVGAASRLAGRGGGTTLPGKLLSKIDPGALGKLVPARSALISATNGKTTTAAMLAAILQPRLRLAHNAAGANLLSGVTSAVLAARDAEFGLFEADEAALGEIESRVAPQVVALGNLFRDQLDRYGELEALAERWRIVAASPSIETLVLNADDPLIASLRQFAEGRVLLYGIDDGRRARPAVQHAADSKYCTACGAPYEYAAAYVGHLGEYRCRECGNARPALDVAARDIQLHGLDGVSFSLATPVGAQVVSLSIPGLYNVYNALAAASVALALDVPLGEIVTGLERFSAAFGRFERIAIGEQRLVMLLIKNPAGANEAVRTVVEAAPPKVAMVALNDEIADGRDVSWIWDVDFEPLLAGLERVVVSGSRAYELALRFAYGGLDRSRIEVIPELGAALDRSLELVPPGTELIVLPTYTAMLALRGVIAGRGHVAEYWEPAA